MFDFKAEMIVYTNTQDEEMVKISDFKISLTKLGVKKFVQ